MKEQEETIQETDVETTETTDVPREGRTRMQVVLGLLWGFVGIYLIFSFISFYITWKNDQNLVLNNGFFKILFSHVSYEDPVYVDSEALVIQNWGGKLGAVVSKKCIHDWFGVAAFGISFFCFFMMLKKWGFLAQYSKLSMSFKILSMMLVVSLTLGFFFNTMCDGNIGGLMGYYVSYQFLRSVFGRFLTGLLLIVGVIAYLLLMFKGLWPFLVSSFTALFKKSDSDVDLDESTGEIDEAQENEEIEDLEPVEETDPQDDGNSTATEEVSVPLDEPVVEEQSEDEPVSVDETETPEENTEEEQSSTPEEEPVLEQEDEEPKQEEPVVPEDEESEDVTDDASESLDDEMTIKNTNTPVEDTKHIEIELTEYDPKADLSHFTMPDVDLLKVYPNDLQAVEVDKEEQLANKNLIEKTLLDFGVEIDSISATVGPTITLYEIVPKAGTRISKIQSLEKDIMMSLSALGIRIIAPIPGKGTVGIEVPNKNRQTVSMYSVINSKKFKESTMELPVALGKTITNDVYMFDLAKMPHLLVAGATGQGKSVGLNAIVTSLLYKKHPSQLKFVMVDPKMVEFSIYSGLIKHYMAQYPGEEDIILTDCLKVTQTLNSLVQEMEDRYKLLMTAHCRNIIEYNAKFIKRQLNPERGHRYLSYIVIIIDEFGDFIMQAGKEIETPIARIAQKARAVGMHLILATQRPSVNVITGIIKANIPGRIAFRTASNIDSRTILDETGAEGLVGMGDLLVTKGGTPERVQCAFVDTPEVERIVSFIGEQRGYSEPYQLPEVKQAQDSTGNSSSGASSDKGDGALDPVFEDAARMIVGSGVASTSAIQRSFSIGFNRAGRIIDQLASKNIVGPYNGSKPREVLCDTIGLEAILNDLRDKGLLGPV